MGDPRRPPAPLLRAFPFAGAAVAGALVFFVARAEPAGVTSLGPLLAEQTAKVEHDWVNARLRRKYVPAPLAPAPCTTLVRNWPQQLAEAYGNVGRNDGERRARRVLEDYLASIRDYQTSMQVQTIAPRISGADAPDPGPPAISNDEVLEMIYLLHIYGYVRLRNNGRGDTLVRRLKLPIGYAKYLMGGEDTWIRLPIPTPGCGPAADRLTTYHLYNNLLVAYLSTPEYHEPFRRNEEKEFDRHETRDEVGDNPLLAILQDSTRPRRGWLWAVSNTERLLRPIKDSLRTLETSPWLAVNLAQVLDSASVEVSPELAPALLDQRDALAQVAARSLQASSEQTDLARPLARLLLLRGIRTGDTTGISALPRRLEAREDSAARAVLLALRWRHDADSLEARLQPGATADSLGVPDSAWLAAARLDLSSQLARIGQNRPAGEQITWVKRAHAVLQGDSVPLALQQLASNRSPARLAQRWPLLAALVVAAAVFAPLWCLAWILRRRRALWVSYYRWEARERLTSGP